MEIIRESFTGSFPTPNLLRWNLNLTTLNCVLNFLFIKKIQIFTLTLCSSCRRKMQLLKTQINLSMMESLQKIKEWVALRH